MEIVLRWLLTNKTSVYSPYECFLMNALLHTTVASEVILLRDQLSDLKESHATVIQEKSQLEQKAATQVTFTVIMNLYFLQCCIAVKPCLPLLVLIMRICVT